jgi:glucose-6-phosphate 1-dehydrogenase
MSTSEQQQQQNSNSGGSVKPKKEPREFPEINQTMVKVCKEVENISFVIFGASGDLAKRKIYPAIFDVFRSGGLPKYWRVIGYARSHMSIEDLQKHVKPFLGEHKEQQLQEFFNHCSYISGQYDNDDDYIALDKVLTEQEQQCNSTKANRLFYLSLPPNIFLEAATRTGKYCKSKHGFNRIVIEKPFGRDLESFEELSRGINAIYSNDEIYRIDHYIGKEVVQNLLVLRFANVIFDPLWNRSAIKSVQIIFKEQLGVEGRGAYFDNYGIIRDVMQNHLMQILTLISMEPPTSLAPEDIRSEKVKVLRSIEPVTRENIVIGQYKGKGDKIGYRDDPTVPDDSLTPTFAACVLKIKNRRWDGVPFLLQCGKALDERVAEIRIQFHEVPANLYTFANVTPNELVIRVQPNESIYFKIMNKVPGLGERLAESQLDFTYKSKYNLRIPDAYERLLFNVLRGDETDFVAEEELRISWRIFSPILHELEEKHVMPELYPFGSKGPDSLHYLAAKYGVKWAHD